MASSTNKNALISLKIDGLILSESYQKCKIFAKQLHRHHRKKIQKPSIKGFIEVDWLEHLNKQQKHIGGQTWAQKKGVVVYIDGTFIGGEEEMCLYFSSYVFKFPAANIITGYAKEEYINYLNRKNLLYTHFDFSIDEKYIGTMLFELRCDLLPQTCTRFALLCNPEGDSAHSYKGSRVDRICKSGWFQAGRLHSPHRRFMEDESLCYKHDRRGIVSFCNDKKNHNSSEFFVTFKSAGWMDEYYVAFGRLVEGLDVLRKLEYTRCTYEFPDELIRIENCDVANVGMGRYFASRLKIKGLTVGDPHIQIETFMDLVFDRFCEILFERLDDEIKKKLHGEWFAEMLWQNVKKNLMTRYPTEDQVDVKDVSSEIFTSLRYLGGLYGHQDIPDHFIKGMLDKAIDDAVDQHDIIELVQSILNFIINDGSLRTAQSNKPESLLVVEDIIEYLTENVKRIISGSLEIPTRGMLDMNLGLKSATEMLPGDSGLRQQLSEIQKNEILKKIHSMEELTSAQSKQNLSTNKSIAVSILDSLLKSLGNI